MSVTTNHIPIGFEHKPPSVVTKANRFARKSLVPLLSTLWSKGRCKVRMNWLRFRPQLGTFSAAVCFTVAAFMVAAVAGLVMAGCMALLLDWKVNG